MILNFEWPELRTGGGYDEFRALTDGDFGSQLEKSAQNDGERASNCRGYRRRIDGES